MSGQLRVLKNRIRSVENTKKITRAMEMVAAAKLRRFQTMMQDAKPFTEGIETLLKRLNGAQGDAERKLHPFFEKKTENRIALVLITSDAGLCGTYNTELINMANAFLAGKKERCLLVGVGKSGISALERKGHRFHRGFTDTRASQVEPVLREFQATLEKLYLDREVDAVYVVYCHFLTRTAYKAVLEKVLPLEEPEAAQEDAPGAGTDYIFEPSTDEIFDRLIPLFFEAKTRMIFLEAFVSEQIARMNAMHQATKNAKEMIESLVLLRNKARQASITKELIEVVSGSQALKLR
ncbi:MAG: ATP synthase F1 subunit gamma [Candidatus Omnitrophota bacterium]|nr:ATP synthase F1 subunit gamma [Candidatus Omnitrophota bacterium]